MNTISKPESVVNIKQTSIWSHLESFDSFCTTLSCYHVSIISHNGSLEMILKVNDFNTI